MDQQPFQGVDISWQLIWGSIVVGLLLGAGSVALVLLLPSNSEVGPRQGLLAGLLCAPLLTGAGAGMMAYSRAGKLKLLHGGLALSISFGLILIFLCILVFIGGQVIGAMR